MTKRTVSLGEASRLLGLSKDATRKRIKRGSLEAKKDKDGYWQVIIEDNVQDTGEDVSRTLTDAMQKEIDFLRRELERKDTIIMSLMAKLPQLQEGQERKQSWWQRFRRKG